MTVALATVWLMRRKMTDRARLLFLIGGVLVFGIIYGLLLRPGLNPNPVASVRSLLQVVLIQHKIVPALVLILVVLLGISWISNKSICGYGCQLGLLQDLLYRAPLPKWQPPFWLTSLTRVIAFVALLGGLSLAGLDWIGLIDPFRLFQFSLTLPIIITVTLVLVVSLFIYRPWCRFLCPFGLTSWLIEQVSFFRPRIQRDVCKGCQNCVKACPSGAMADFYAGKRIHADCFACGKCITACPVQDALAWRKPSTETKVSSKD